MDVVIKSEDKTDDPAYVQQMVDKARAARGEAVEQPAGETPASNEGDAQDRPEWLPEKFKSPEDLAKAYAELEKKQGQKPQQEQQQEAPAVDDPAGLSVEQQQALDKGGIDMGALRSEFQQNGALSDETYAKLEGAGFSRADVDTYIEGQKAIVERIRTQSFELVGGEQNFNAMRDWARANLPANEIATFNQLVTNGDTRETALLGLYAKYTKAAGSEPKNVVDGAGPAATGDVYESRAQLVKDMNSPEYNKDPAFRSKVEAKLLRTRKAGKNIWQ